MIDSDGFRPNVGNHSGQSQGGVLWGKANRAGLLAVPSRWYQARRITGRGPLQGTGGGNWSRYRRCGNHQLYPWLAEIPPPSQDGAPQFAPGLRGTKTEMVPAEDAFRRMRRYAVDGHGLAGIRRLAVGLATGTRLGRSYRLNARSIDVRCESSRRGCFTTWNSGARASLPDARRTHRNDGLNPPC